MTVVVSVPIGIVTRIVVMGIVRVIFTRHFGVVQSCEISQIWQINLCKFLEVWGKILWKPTLTFNPNSMRISNWARNVANQMKTTWIDQGLRGLSQKYISRKLRVFWGQILNSICCLCNNYDVSQLWCGVVVVPKGRLSLKWEWFFGRF